MADNRIKWQIIHEVKELRNKEAYIETYINPDLTQEQRRLGAQLRKELKTKRESDPSGKYKTQKNRESSDSSQTDV